MVDGGKVCIILLFINIHFGTRGGCSLPLQDKKIKKKPQLLGTRKPCRRGPWPFRFFYFLLVLALLVAFHMNGHFPTILAVIFHFLGMYAGYLPVSVSVTKLILVAGSLLRGVLYSFVDTALAGR
eukprot:GHVL01017823.1.p1 GENE.GHVL01017823.1~~GHVL01017823.1.p1  ORF type:complete len:125 (+),score=3.58 GHVL01017823.1:127-501(+)